MDPTEDDDDNDDADDENDDADDTCVEPQAQGG